MSKDRDRFAALLDKLMTPALRAALDAMAEGPKGVGPYDSEESLTAAVEKLAKLEEKEGAG